MSQHSGWLCPGVYRANRLRRHRLPFEGHAPGHIARNGIPAEAQLALRRQGLPLAYDFDVAHR